jgi:4-hydroxybenzoate polyprenyltransferase
MAVVEQQVGGIGAVRWSAYVKIARPDHWIKNIFLLPGVAVALSITPHRISAIWLTLPLGMLSLCLIASANYTINEYLDAPFDRFHPLKKNRPGAQKLLDGKLVFAQYLVLIAVGCGVAAIINLPFLLTSVILLLMGIAYNVPPLRTKDKIYLDVLSESINNPLRFLLGWFLVARDVVPPSSVLIAYWMGGAFLMGIKRYAEYRRIAAPDLAALYRRSFARYTEQSLLLSSFFYALCSSFFMAIFLVKYRIELVFTFPLFSALFTWYLALGMRPESAAQAPEKLYREVPLLVFAGFVFLVAILLTFIRLPFLQTLMSPYFVHV